MAHYVIPIAEQEIVADFVLPEHRYCNHCGQGQDGELVGTWKSDGDMEEASWVCSVCDTQRVIRYPEQTMMDFVGLSE